MFRRMTRCVKIGSLEIGGPHPIRVQSMTNTPTADIRATLNQIRNLYENRCEIVRIAVPSLASVEALKQIRTALINDKIDIPLVADTHFSAIIALRCLPFADKVRINPGNFPTQHGEFANFVREAKKEGKSIRIGINQGSLPKDLVKQYGDNAAGMVESALQFLKITSEENFHNVVLSFKSSNVPLLVQVNQLAVEKLDKLGFNYPIHLGVTEAGNESYGRIKAATGIGSLLLNGIGDTIRVSLTEDPLLEIPVAYEILQACGRRYTRTEFVACPSCGRTQFDIQKVFSEIKQKTAQFPNVKIAVMGCVVNGLGEMGDADFGYIGAGPGKINLYRKGVCVKANIPESSAIDELLALIQTDAL